jgi:radical SAM superfamily enzyme YgiQ (UPF0313 family)
MSNLGFHGLFHRVASHPGIRASRFFYEKGSLWSPDREDGSSPPSLSGYDLLFFTISFEPDYLNVFRMLEQSNIPAAGSSRKIPLVVMGGVTVTSNGTVMAPVADLICRGDMEAMLPGLLELLDASYFVQAAAAPEIKKELLKTAAAVPGVYAPEIDADPPDPVFLPEITDPVHSVAVTGRTEFSNMFLIEIARGCRNTCTFCMTRCASPARTIERELLTETAARALPFAEKAGLVAPVVTDHPELAEIVLDLGGLGMKVSLSSLRADRFTERIAALLRENGQKSVTFAPETGSVELRRKIGKTLTDQELLSAVSVAAAHGIRRVRLYFMYGVPGETEQDIQAAADLAARAAGLMGRGGQLHLSVNPFVPKKRTVLQDLPLMPEQYYRTAQERLKKMLAGVAGVTVRFESLRGLQMHYVLSIGNARTGQLLLECLDQGMLRQFPRKALEEQGLES